MKLLPCPFCGGRARFNEIEEGENEGGRYIECCKCNASTALFFPSKMDVTPILAEKWNKRTSKPLPKKSKRQLEWEAYIDELDGVE